MVARQVLHLNQPACEASGTISPHVLDQSACPTIAACDGEHSLVLLHRRFRQVLAQPQHLSDLPASSLECGLHLGLCQRLQGAVVLSEPVFKLDRAIVVLQAGELLGALDAGVTVTAIGLNRMSSQRCALEADRSACWSGIGDLLSPSHDLAELGRVHL